MLIGHKICLKQLKARLNLLEYLCIHNRTPDSGLKEQDEEKKVQRKYGLGKDPGISSTSQLKGI